MLSVPALILALVMAAGSAASAQGRSISVDPTEGLPLDGATLTVSGQGFSTEGNGLYVVFGPVTSAPGYYTDPSIYSAFRWVHKGAGDSPIEAPLADDGSFSTTLQVTSTFTTSAGDVDCVITACAVITFAAHGSPDRTQDACVAITFTRGAAGSPGPMSPPPPSAIPSTAPVSSAEPGPSAAPGGSDACAAIGAVTP
jgi:hypothetical protein